MVCFPFLVVLHRNKLCSPITIKHPRLSFIVSNGFVKNNERIFSRHTTEYTITHDLTRTIITKRNKFLSSQFFCFDNVPISMPHYIWYWPFITLVFSWLLSCYTWFLQTFLNHDLTNLSQRDFVAFLYKVLIEFSCSILCFFPLLYYKIVEFVA